MDLLNAELQNSEGVRRELIKSFIHDIKLVDKSTVTKLVTKNGRRYKYSE